MDITTRLAQWAENDMRAEGIALDAKYEIERLREALLMINNVGNTKPNPSLADRLLTQAAFEAATYKVDVDRLVDAASEIIRLTKALQYYADKKEDDWKNGDDGVVARSALQQNGSK